MLDLFKTPFTGFDVKDFACYTQDKWSSRLHNRARMGVVDKLGAIGRDVKARLEAADVAVDYETNQPIPNVFNNKSVDAQWLFFTRDKEAQRELATFIDREHSVEDNLRDAAHYKRHLMLAVKIHEGGADVMMGLHRHAWIDAHNGARKLQDEWEAESLDILLKKLTEATGGALHLVGPLGVTAIADCDAATLRQNLESLSEAQEWFILGRNYAPDAPEVAEENFVQEVGDLMESLIPVYNFLLWGRDNDHVALRGELESRKELARRDGVDLAPGTEVRIISGLFSGRTGVVQDIDKKGMVKVNVGNMVIQVKGKAIQTV